MINFQYLCIFKEKPRTLQKKTLRNQYLKFVNWNFAIFKVSNCKRLGLREYPPKKKSVCYRPSWIGAK